MSKSFYVVCKEVRRYFSKSDFSIASLVPAFGSSDLDEISECVKVHNIELDDYFTSEFVSFPITLCYYQYFEISNLD